VGLMQGALGIYGARLNEVPMIVLSGESMSFGDDESFNPGGQWYNNHNFTGGLQRSVDPFVKWAHQNTSIANVYEMIIRAGEISQAAPAGPVYLDIPIEVMMAKWAPPQKMKKAAPPAKTVPAPSEIEQVVKMIAEAKNPIITAADAGRTKEGYDAMVALAELLALPVVEGGSSNSTNFPKEHPLHQGFEANPLLKEADLVLVVRSRVPWYPANMGPINAKVVIIDEAPHKLHHAYQNLQADLFLVGDVPATLRLIAEAARSSKPDAGKIKERRERWEAAHAKLEQRYRNAEKDAAAKGGVQAVSVAATLGQALPADTIYLDETTLHGGINRKHVANRGAQSFVAMRSGLGQGLGIGLGVKMARPKQPVVVLIGDGAFMYNPAAQCFAFARDAGCPIMAVVYNNKGYRAMRENQRSYYPDGAGAKNKIFPGEPVTGFDYEKMAPLFGGVGFRIDNPGEMKGTLEKAGAALADGKSAIVNVLLNE
jgi:acetolactate synthase I/II/III large subunit